ncbi:MAG: acyltransferase [Clostridia bacterium]|nr:acyltransferase [Clostridia bacterium]
MGSVVKKSGYNYCLDFIKGIACICVVFMHCEFPGIMGTAIQSISRFCVPFFFMVSGYFCYYEDKTRAKSTWLKIKHILMITAVASLFYAITAVITAKITGKTLNVSINQILYWLVFNNPSIIVSQLWFLFALIYVYIMYAVVERFNLYRLAYIMIPILLLIYTVMAQGAHLAGVSIPNMYYRNFLIEGFPLFMLGHWIHRNKDRLDISNKTLIVVIAASTLLCVAERFILGRDFGVNICSFPQVTALFLYAVNNPEKHEGAVQRLGKDCSMLVYILHPFVWHSFEGIYSKVGIGENTAALYIMPIIVVIVSIGLAVLCNTVSAHIKKVRGKYA